MWETTEFPAASWTVASAVTSAGTSGPYSMPVRNDVVMVETSTAPASAVAINPPRLVTELLRAAAAQSMAELTHAG